LKGKRGRGTLDGNKPPVLGLLQRDGEVVIRMLPNVQQVTIQPVITSTVVPRSQFYTDEYNIYNRLPEWSYLYKSVNHSAGEYARDEDGDGFHEVHVNIWKFFGFCFVLDCDLIEVFLKRSYPGIWASLNSSTMFADAARLCFIPC
jgi:transposase